MRIVHVLPSLEAEHGGPPAVAAQLAFAQAAHGAEVRIVSPQPRTGKKPVETPTPRGGPGVVETRCFSRGGRVGRALGLDALATLSEAIGWGEAVHVHGIWSPTMLRAVGLARRAHKPVVLSPHGMLSEWALSQKRLKKTVALAAGFRGVVHGADACHALSRYEADCTRGWGYRGRIEIVPNGVDLEGVDGALAPGSFRAGRPELGEDPYIVFISRLHPVKRLDLLADAFAEIASKHPSLRLVIIGPDWGAEEDLRARIQRLGIAGRTHLLGPVFGPEKFNALAESLCFCLPSQHEGFSVAILEALASRTPAVISDQCNFSEVADAGAGRIVPLDARRLAEALDLYASDRAERDAAAARARSLVEREYTWPTIAQRLLGLYRELAGARGAAT